MGQKFIIRAEMVGQTRNKTVNFTPNFYKKFEKNTPMNTMEFSSKGISRRNITGESEEYQNTIRNFIGGEEK